MAGYHQFHAVNVAVEEAVRFGWNADKSYLVDLALPHVPTARLDDPTGLPELVRRWGTVVVKPCVGADGRGVVVFDGTDGGPADLDEATLGPGPWVVQSLFLAAIGDARVRGAKALETFAYRYREGESQYDRFLVHKTIFPADFLADFGFQTLRRAGHVELARLDFGGLVPVAEGKRDAVIRLVKEAFVPAPVPQRP